MDNQPNGENLELACCPPMERDGTCDVLDYHYRQRYATSVVANNQRVQVEVITHVRVERCPGPLAVGDLAYTTTLLPGEQVRLFTADRRTRFSFDSASSISYRNQQTSEERFFMASMENFMSDLSVRDESHGSSRSSGKSEGHAETNGAISAFFDGPSVDVSGSYSAESSSDFLRELKQHSEASHNRAVAGTRTASSVSVGEVQTRSHAEGTTEDHFESSSRVFSNPNHCHAVTFLFYQINKKQTTRITLESIERRVVDPAASTRVINNRFISAGDVGVIPNAVLATDANRLQVEEIGRRSVQLREAAGQQPQIAGTGAALRTFTPAVGVVLEPLPPDIRQKALDEVDERLIAQGLLDRETRALSPKAKAEFDTELHSSIPTPGLLVKGCLDDCDICEPDVHREIELDLERKELENKLLARQIELLDKAQEYRCCLADEDED